MTTHYRVEVDAPPKPQVVRLWRDHLGLVADPDLRSRWLYPAGDGERSHCLLLFAREGSAERLIGAAGVHPRTCWASGRAVRAGLHMDLVVDPAHRTLRPALLLVREARRFALERFELAYGFANPQSLPVFRRARYQVAGKTTRLARVLRHEEYVSRAGGKLVAPVAGAVLDYARIVGDLPRRVRAAREARLDWSESAPADLDPLFERARERHAFTVDRSQRFLRWRFEQEPLGGNVFALLRRRGAKGELRAYAVIRREGDMVRIRDLFGFPEDLGRLTDLLLPELRARGGRVASIELCLSGPTVATLESRGFQYREHGADLVVAGAPAADAMWHVTEADRDT